VTATYLTKSSGPSSIASAGDDTITVTSVVTGNVDIFKSELEKLSTVGKVTVSSAMGAKNACTWKVTFDTLAGLAVPLMQVSFLQNPPVAAASAMTLANGDTITIAQFQAGTSVAIGGAFTLEFNGQRTGYLPYTVSATALQAALRALPTVGNVNVDPSVLVDENGGRTWVVTFLTNLGPLPLLIADYLDITGTVGTVVVSEKVKGVMPPFNSADYASTTVTNLSSLQAVAGSLRTGIPYYFRVSAMNGMGTGPSTIAFPPWGIPLPQTPSAPTNVALAVSLGLSSISLPPSLTNLLCLLPPLSLLFLLF
jgi:hypothetical protein